LLTEPRWNIAWPFPPRETGWYLRVLIDSSVPDSFSTTSASLGARSKRAATSSSSSSSLISITPLPGPASSATSSTAQISARPSLLAHATLALGVATPT
jgi:hypothetical protein